MKPNRKELQALVAKVQGLAPDAERLSALDDIFAICNQCSTRSERRAFYDLIPPKKIPLLAKLAVARSGKGTVALSPGAEKLLDELATWAKSYDPAPDLAAAAIKRGDEKEILPVVLAIIAELRCETLSERAWLATKLKQPGQGRIGALGHIVVRRRGSDTAQRYAQVLLHSIVCAECSQDQKRVRCGCGCRRQLCEKCRGLDENTALILKELSQVI